MEHFPPPLPHGTSRAKNCRYIYIPGTYQASNKENTKCNDKTSAGVTAKKRRKQGKRQRSACQEQPETRGMMEHDTRRVGYSLWCGWVVRDRSTYIGTSDKVQHKQAWYDSTCRLPGTILQHKHQSDVPQKKEGICPRHNISRRENHAHRLYQTPDLGLRVSLSLIHI